MEKSKKLGFTMVELLVAMFILVIAFGLVTYLYTRAARIRKIVVVHSDVQQVLSQQMDTLTYGDKGNWGIIDATEIGPASSESTLEAYNGADKMEARIDQDEEDTITLAWGDYYANKMILDVGRKLTVKNIYNAPSTTIPPSSFEYFNNKGEAVIPSTSAEEVTFVKITMWARSTDPSFSDSTAVPLITGVRLRNKPSF